LNFTFTPEQQSFREDLCTFLQESVPESEQTTHGYFSESQYAFSRRLYKQMALKRWLTIGWPAEFGGGGKGFVEQAIFDEEIGYHRVQRVGITGLSFVGPALIRFGSTAQKAKYLPPIASGDVEYCQGFTEPNAGSDLASLEMTATKEGNNYVLNGSKIYTSFYKHADYIYLLARTDLDVSKHRGISLFIVPSDQTGISYREIPFIIGESSAQIYFDNVKVSFDSLIGDENQGWYYAMTTLDYERAQMERYARVRRTFDEFLHFCQTHGLAKEPIVQHKLAKLKMDFDTWKLLCWKVAWMQSENLLPNAEASSAFLFGTDQRLRFSQEASEILGFYSILLKGSDLTPMNGAIEGLTREALHMHGAGTQEIHRNIVAQRGLGLPR